MTIARRRYDGCTLSQYWR